MSETEQTTIFGHALRFSKFGIVGFIGIFVNMGMLYVFREIFHMPYYVSGLFAIELSIITNFILNDVWTWRDRREKHLFIRFIRYNAAATFTSFGMNYPILLALVYLLGVNYLLANLIGIAIASLFNFIINHHWTYGRKVLQKRWLANITWILFVFVVILIIVGIVIFVTPGIQKIILSQVLSRLKTPLNLSYSRIDVIDGRIKVSEFTFGMEAFEMSTDSVVITPPAAGIMHLDSVYVYGLIFSRDISSEGEENGGGKRDPINIPVSVNHIYLDNGNLDLGGAVLNDVHLKATIEDGVIPIDTLAMKVEDRGEILSMKGTVGFTEQEMGIYWEKADIVAKRSFIQSYGQITFSPLDFNFSVESDSFDLVEIDSFLQFYVLNGSGTMHMNLKGNPQGVLTMGTYIDGILFDFPFVETSTEMVWNAARRSLTLNNLEGNILDADIEGDVEFSFVDNSYEFTAYASGFELSSLIEDLDLPTYFTGNVSGRGRNFEPEEMVLNLNIDLIKSMFFDIWFDSAYGNVIVTVDTFDFAPELFIYRGGNEIKLTGDLAYEGNMRMTADCIIPNLADIMAIVDLDSMVGGRAEGVLNLSSTSIDPEVAGYLVSDSIFAQIVYADSLYANFHIVDLASGLKGWVDLGGSGSTFDMEFDSLKSSLNVRNDGVLIRNADMWMDSMYFYMMGDFSLEQDSMLLRFDGFRARAMGLEMVLQHSAWMKFKGDTILSRNIPLGLGTGDINVDSFRVDPFGTRVGGNIENIRLENILHQMKINASMRADIDGSYWFVMEDSLQNAEAGISLTTEHLVIDSTEWGRGIFDVTLDRGMLSMDNVRFVHDLEVYSLKGSLDVFDEDMPLYLTFQGKGQSTILMQAFSENIENFNADIDYILDIKGTPENPNISGSVEVRDGSLDLYTLDNTVENITIKAGFDDNRLELDTFYIEMERSSENRKGLVQGLIDFISGLFGSKDNNRGYAYVKGAVNLGDFTNPRFDLSVKSEKLPVDMSRMGIFLALDTDLAIGGDMENPDLTGSINIPRGTIVNLSGGSGGGSATTIPVDMAIELTIPDNFWIYLEYPFMWAEIEIDGDLVVETIDGFLALQGELGTLRGEVNAYGSKFNIEQGDILFDQGTDLDPSLDIKAVTNIYSDSMGVRQDPVPIELSITGRASEPQLELSAGSYTSEELILMLTLNQNPNNVGLVDAVGDRATDVLKTYGWNQVSKGVESALGVEEFQITPVQSGDKQEDYRVSVGKYITPKIYLSYSYEGFTGSENKGDIGDIYVEYQIAPNIKLVGGRGTDRTSQEGIETYKLELDFKWTY